MRRFLSLYSCRWPLCSLVNHPLLDQNLLSHASQLVKRPDYVAIRPKITKSWNSHMSSTADVLTFLIPPRMDLVGDVKEQGARRKRLWRQSRQSKKGQRQPGWGIRLGEVGQT